MMELLADADSADAAVPTLNEWGMILMGLILAGIAAVAIRRQRAADW